MPESVEVGPFVTLGLTYDKGIPIGILSDDHLVLLSLMAWVTLSLIAAFMLWARGPKSGVFAAALGAASGGMLGNLIDRLRFGAVLEFIEVIIYGIDWRFFNVAEVAVCVGIFTIGSLLLRQRRAASHRSRQARSHD